LASPHAYASEGWRYIRQGSCSRLSCISCSNPVHIDNINLNLPRATDVVLPPCSTHVTMCSRPKPCRVHARHPHILPYNIQCCWQAYNPKSGRPLLCEVQTTHQAETLLFFNRAGSHQLSYSCNVPVLSAGMERGSPWLVALPGATITTCFKHGAPMVHTPARACTRYVHWPPEGRGHTTPAALRHCTEALRIGGRTPLTLTLNCQQGSCCKVRRCSRCPAMLGGIFRGLHFRPIAAMFQCSCSECLAPQQGRVANCITIQSYVDGNSHCPGMCLDQSTLQSMT
jgi:hypothetical protein